LTARKQNSRVHDVHPSARVFAAPHSVLTPEDCGKQHNIQGSGPHPV
jgi:hypothetical protein